VTTTSAPAEVTRYQTLLEVQDVAKAFPLRAGLIRSKAAVHAVSGVSFALRRGEVLGIVGESGSGKSTLARLVLGLIPVDRGAVTFAGIDVIGATRDRLKTCRRGMQIVFQDPLGALDPRMRIGQSVVAPMAQHRMGTRAERDSRVIELLELVGLDSSFVDRFPSECSGGELQRVVIARALSLEPQLLICDEPTAALDASNRAQILNVLEELRDRLDLSLIMISHDLRLISVVSNRIAVMYLGEFVEVCSSAATFGQPLHPYTRQLIAASVLDRSVFESDTLVIDGEPASPVNPPSGCSFHPRCPLATQRCADEAPVLEEVRDGHWVSCFHWDVAAPDWDVATPNGHVPAPDGR
jgi:oligopeptide/dipeptide ABC transporter ATP-binding protein